jgi:hypothetical protein
MMSLDGTEMLSALDFLIVAKGMLVYIFHCNLRSLISIFDLLVSLVMMRLVSNHNSMLFRRPDSFCYAMYGLCRRRKQDC